MKRQISSFFTRNNDPESNRYLHYNPIKKEDNLHVKYLIDSAVLAIVRTTNSIVKFDSSASFKIVPRLENFSGYGPE